MIHSPESSTVTGYWPHTGATSFGTQPFLDISLRFKSSKFRKFLWKPTKESHCYVSKPMSRRRQLSLAWSAIAKQTAGVQILRASLIETNYWCFVALYFIPRDAMVASQCQHPYNANCGLTWCQIIFHNASDVAIWYNVYIVFWTHVDVQNHSQWNCKLKKLFIISYIVLTTKSWLLLIVKEWVVSMLVKKMCTMTFTVKIICFT